MQLHFRGGRKTALIATGALVLLTIPLASLNSSAATVPVQPSDSRGLVSAQAQQQLLTRPTTPNCPASTPGTVACDSLTTANGTTATTAPVAGALSPSDIRSAYKLSTVTGTKPVAIAIVDAYNDPTVVADVTAYRKYYGLGSCSTCLKVVNQAGGTSPLPATNTGWATEISLDVDMVTSACPSCAVTLVEANSTTDADLHAAVSEAVKLGARVVSMSWGETEYSAEVQQTFLNATNVQFVASAGDNAYAYGLEFPAASNQVTAVVGTILTRSTTATRGWTEAVWSKGSIPLQQGTGSGCSKYISKSPWQTDSGCKLRTDNDVAAVAQGVSVYDASAGSSGPWVVESGTSVSAPLIAAIYALGGDPGHTAQQIYAAKSSLFDVTSGNDGSCISTPYLCTAEVGYDGPTGLGTPNGIGAFNHGTAKLTLSSSLVYPNIGGYGGCGSSTTFPQVLTLTGQTLPPSKSVTAKLGSTVLGNVTTSTTGTLTTTFNVPKVPDGTYTVSLSTSSSTLASASTRVGFFYCVYFTPKGSTFSAYWDTAGSDANAKLSFQINGTEVGAATAGTNGAVISPTFTETCTVTAPTMTVTTQLGGQSVSNDAVPYAICPSGSATLKTGTRAVEVSTPLTTPPID